MDQDELREKYFDIYYNVSRILYPMIQEELNKYWEMKVCYPECLEKMQEIQDAVVDALATIQKKGSAGHPRGNRKTTSNDPGRRRCPLSSRNTAE